MDPVAQAIVIKIVITVLIELLGFLNGLLEPLNPIIG